MSAGSPPRQTEGVSSRFHSIHEDTPDSLAYTHTNDEDNASPFSALHPQPLKASFHDTTISCSEGLTDFDSRAEGTEADPVSNVATPCRPFKGSGSDRVLPFATGATLKPASFSYQGGSLTSFSFESSRTGWTPNAISGMSGAPLLQTAYSVPPLSALFTETKQTYSVTIHAPLFLPECRKIVVEDNFDIVKIARSWPLTFGYKATSQSVLRLKFFTAPLPADPEESEASTVDRSRGSASGGGSTAVRGEKEKSNQEVPHTDRRVLSTPDSRSTTSKKTNTKTETPNTTTTTSGAFEELRPFGSVLIPFSCLPDTDVGYVPGCSVCLSVESPPMTSSSRLGCLSSSSSSATGGWTGDGLMSFHKPLRELLFPPHSSSTSRGDGSGISSGGGGGDGRLSLSLSGDGHGGGGEGDGPVGGISVAVAEKQFRGAVNRAEGTFGIPQIRLTFVREERGGEEGGRAEFTGGLSVGTEENGRVKDKEEEQEESTKEKEIEGGVAASTLPLSLVSSVFKRREILVGERERQAAEFAQGLLLQAETLRRALRDETERGSKQVEDLRLAAAEREQMLSREAAESRRSLEMAQESVRRLSLTRRADQRRIAGLEARFVGLEAHQVQGHRHQQQGAEGTETGGRAVRVRSSSGGVDGRFISEGSGSGVSRRSEGGEVRVKSGGEGGRERDFPKGGGLGVLSAVEVPSALEEGGTVSSVSCCFSDGGAAPISSERTSNGGKEMGGSSGSRPRSLLSCSSDSAPPHESTATLHSQEGVLPPPPQSQSSSVLSEAGADGDTTGAVGEAALFSAHTEATPLCAFSSAERRSKGPRGAATDALRAEVTSEQARCQALQRRLDDREAFWSARFDKETRKLKHKLVTRSLCEKEAGRQREKAQAEADERVKLAVKEATKGLTAELEEAKRRLARRDDALRRLAERRGHLSGASDLGLPVEFQTPLFASRAPASSERGSRAPASPDGVLTEVRLDAEGSRPNQTDVGGERGRETKGAGVEGRHASPGGSAVENGSRENADQKGKTVHGWWLHTQSSKKRVKGMKAGTDGGSSLQGSLTEHRGPRQRAALPPFSPGAPPLSSRTSPDFIRLCMGEIPSRGDRNGGSVGKETEGKETAIRIRPASARAPPRLPFPPESPPSRSDPDSIQISSRTDTEARPPADSATEDDGNGVHTPSDTRRSTEPWVPSPLQEDEEEGPYTLRDSRAFSTAHSQNNKRNQMNETPSRPHRPYAYPLSCSETPGRPFSLSGRSHSPSQSLFSPSESTDTVNLQGKVYGETDRSTGGEGKIPTVRKEGGAVESVKENRVPPSGQKKGTKGEPPTLPFPFPFRSLRQDLQGSSRECSFSLSLSKSLSLSQSETNSAILDLNSPPVSLPMKDKTKDRERERDSQTAVLSSEGQTLPPGKNRPTPHVTLSLTPVREEGSLSLSMQLGGRGNSTSSSSLRGLSLPTGAAREDSTPPPGAQRMIQHIPSETLLNSTHTSDSMQSVPTESASRVVARAVPSVSSVEGAVGGVDGGRMLLQRKRQASHVPAAVVSWPASTLSVEMEQPPEDQEGSGGDMGIGAGEGVGGQCQSVSGAGRFASITSEATVVTAVRLQVTGQQGSSGKGEKTGEGGEEAAANEKQIGQSGECLTKRGEKENVQPDEEADPAEAEKEAEDPEGGGEVETLTLETPKKKESTAAEADPGKEEDNSRENPPIRAEAEDEKEQIEEIAERDLPISGPVPVLPITGGAGVRSWAYRLPLTEARLRPYCSPRTPTDTSKRLAHLALCMPSDTGPRAPAAASGGTKRPATGVKKGGHSSRQSYAPAPAASRPKTAGALGSRKVAQEVNGRVVSQQSDNRSALAALTSPTHFRRRPSITGASRPATSVFPSTPFALSRSPPSKATASFVPPLQLHALTAQAQAQSFPEGKQLSSFTIDLRMPRWPHQPPPTPFAACPSSFSPHPPPHNHQNFPHNSRLPTHTQELESKLPPPIQADSLSSQSHSRPPNRHTVFHYASAALPRPVGGGAASVLQGGNAAAPPAQSMHWPPSRHSTALHLQSLISPTRTTPHTFHANASPPPFAFSQAHDAAPEGAHPSRGVGGIGALPRPSFRPAPLTSQTLPADAGEGRQETEQHGKHENAPPAALTQQQKPRPPLMTAGHFNFVPQNFQPPSHHHSHQQQHQAAGTFAGSTQTFPAGRSPPHPAVAVASSSAFVSALSPPPVPFHFVPLGFPGSGAVQYGQPQ
uniref:Uncharacterized protein n=1 Tax=Chromera velia CCMP2878 TaxID=1169474 RepID=A0A0G4IAX4_9ALVE|eukprot:Cvel_2146.t1-p1 / transcript=Cvel_2146.t1 / gene=Cvel_2146 / organism=Chromera_velia_CCMP2878 / gene_product=hypothetical protein / transcript_product=hypothetical protein / location=Cvel_scaffold83:74829-83757(+) / protein_length=2223 / sequence_SO=supercontig / SO=protein_coding / is_pseudo=false